MKRIQLSQRLCSSAIHSSARQPSRNFTSLSICRSFQAHPEVTLATAETHADLDPPSQRVRNEAHSQRQLYTLDPLLSRSMAYLAPGWSVQDIHRLYVRDTTGILAFDDSWTAVGWSEWWVRNAETVAGKKVVILHLDDHQDLVEPLLVKQQHDAPGWIDALTHLPFSADVPESVASAVVSGAIGIGCFFVPWIHHIPNLEILHLQRGVTTPEQRLLTPSFKEDARIGSATLRPTVENRIYRSSADPDGTRYMRASHLETLLSQIHPEDRVLLHIDLDYFNDGLAGGAALKPNEPSPPQMKVLISEICEQLAGTEIGRRIEHTSICLSPGFCPSAYWGFLLAHLRKNLKQIGCVCP